MENFIFILEIIGVITFSISGALEGIKTQLDLLGILILGLVTALGGGLVRDLFLGVYPANSFRNPVYIYVAIVSSLLVFIPVYLSNEFYSKIVNKKFEQILIFFDALGLSLFTILGMNIAFSISRDWTSVFYIFIGLITGVGGGIIRDMLNNKVPYILDRNVYASASILGAVLYLILRRLLGNLRIAMVISIVFIFALRMFAAKYRWNLPKATRIKNENLRKY